jgi:subtilisin family serine protease
MKRQGFIFPAMLSVICFIGLEAQEKGVPAVDMLDKTYLNWYNLDPRADNIQGAAVNRAYNDILKNRSPLKKIIVAVIDGGVDIDHSDLKGRIWTNPGELPGNGKDDDLNGYVDDIHGWNFIGNGNGENIDYENLEQVRIFKKLDSKYKDVSSPDHLNKSDQEEYKLYLECKRQYEDELKEYTDMGKMLSSFESNKNSAESVIKTYLKKDEITRTDVEQIKSGPEDVKNARSYLLRIYKLGITDKMLEEMKDINKVYLDFRLNTAYNPRDIISDNPEDLNDRLYGNGNIKGPTSEHGTFVAGIIAAGRNNNLGIDGIAENVEIMALRVVPDGDERDKDVALAIRYAVDQGAMIINMSFGKDYSPQKLFVDEAIKYASENNVLLVHAAGNEAENLDELERYPTNALNDGIRLENWISVGATRHKLDKDFCAEFSNYGQTRVDMFAPGVNIISLFPENTYELKDGTSFSCPVVTGVAALIWSYYPSLTALELKEVLLNSTVRYPKAKVYIPNDGGNERIKTKFSTLSRTGGIVNAYNAILAAEKITSQKAITMSGRMETTGSN